MYRRQHREVLKDWNIRGVVGLLRAGKTKRDSLPRGLRSE